MIRKPVLSLVLALVLVLPSAGHSQNDTGGSRSGRQAAATPGAQEFLSAFQIIRDYALEVHSDSTLWFRAVDGLIQELNDAYAQAFAPAE